MHADKPNAQAFLILYDVERADARKQSEALGAALTKAGTIVDMMPVEDGTHIGINFNLGKPGNPETERARGFSRQAGGTRGGSVRLGFGADQAMGATHRGAVIGYGQCIDRDPAFLAETGRG